MPHLVLHTVQNHCIASQRMPGAPVCLSVSSLNCFTPGSRQCCSSLLHGSPVPGIPFSHFLGCHFTVASWSKVKLWCCACPKMPVHYSHTGLTVYLGLKYMYFSQNVKAKFHFLIISRISVKNFSDIFVLDSLQVIFSFHLSESFSDLYLWCYQISQ